MIKKIFLMSIVAILFSFNVVSAEEALPEAGILPDSPFYFFKNISEGIGTFFAFGEVAKTERFMYLAEKRLAEAKALAEKDSSDEAQKTTAKYEEHVTKAKTKAEEARAKGKNVDDILTKFAESNLRHQEVLARVYEKAPEQARPALEKVMERSSLEHKNAFDSVSKEKKDEIIKVHKEQRDGIRKDVLNKLRESGVPVKDIDYETGSMNFDSTNLDDGSLPEGVEEVDNLGRDIEEEINRSMKVFEGL